MWATCTLGHAHWGRRGAAGLLIARRGEVLLQLRAAWSHRGGTWSIPGGALERGESAVAAALREAGEELGISPEHVAVGDSRPYECGGWVYDTVLATARDGLTVRLLAESDDHRWVLAEQVSDLPLHPGFRAAWEHEDDVLRSFVAAS